MRNSHARVLTVTALAAILVACAPGFKPTPTPSDPAAAIDGQLQALQAAGDYTGAAQLYLGLSGTAEQQREWRLRAAEILLEGGDPQGALALTNELDNDPLDPDQKARLGLLRTRAALIEDDLPGALAALPTANTALHAPRQAEVLDTRITVFARAGQPVDEILDRLQFDRLEGIDASARQSNRDALWRLLPRLPDEELQTLPSVDRDLVGWIALLEVARVPINESESFDTAIRAWQSRFAGHPASAQASSLASARLNRRVPSALALLIPASGHYAVAGRQVRSGFQASYNRALEPKPRLQSYDTGVSSVEAELDRASTEGASLAVGPLVKTDVASAAAATGRRLPLLALNRIPELSTSPAPLYQFGLAPEDEAVQIAADALRAGARRALAMYPQGDWGERVYLAFAETFEAGGGSIVGTSAYDDQLVDFTPDIKQLFLMEAGDARRSRLQGTIGHKLEFDARRRDDVDFMMLAAFAQPARLLYPQLRFFRVGDLPVLATSNVYAGSEDAGRDRDLSGLRFLDLPFLIDLDQQQREAWVSSAEAGKPPVKPDRLFALGADAYTLTPWLQALAASPGSEINGLTGRLSIDPDGRVVRTLRWAEFHDGVPIALDDSPLSRL